MKRLVAPVVFIALIFGIVTVFATWNSANKKPIPDTIANYAVTPEVIRDIKVTDKDNKSVDITNDMSKPTLLTFWSSSCSVCGEGLKNINDTKSDKYQNVLINLGDTPQIAADYLKKNNLTFTTYFDLDKSVYQSWKPEMPSSYYIDKKQVLYLFPGQITKELLESLNNSL